jgi:protein-L-isoaspartate(D-aspartate) O-methyltransferase
MNTTNAIEHARFNMIEQQIRPWDVLQAPILAMLSVVKREDFVPVAHKALAFVDMEIPLYSGPQTAANAGQCMLAPRVEARMLQEMSVKPTDKVLEIGTGSGYMAALLAYRADHVTTYEIDPGLARIARENLRQAGITNVDVREADGALTRPGGLFDVIVLSGSVDHIPAALLAQLKPGGRLGAIVGDQPMMRAHIALMGEAGLVTTRQPWDTVAPRLLNFPEPSRFSF